MIEAGRDPEEEEEEKQGGERPGERDQGHRRADAEPAREEEGPVFVFVGDADDEELDEDRRDETEVGQQADLGVARDEELPVVEDGKDRGDDDSGRVR